MTDEGEALVGKNTRNNTAFIRPVKSIPDKKDDESIDVFFLEPPFKDLSQTASTMDRQPVYSFPVFIRYSKSAGKPHDHYHNQLTEAGIDV